MTSRIAMRQQYKKTENFNKGVKTMMEKEDVRYQRALEDYRERRLKANGVYHERVIDELLEVNHQQRLVIEQKAVHRKKPKRDFMENLALIMVIIVSAMFGYALLMAMSLMFRFIATL